MFRGVDSAVKNFLTSVPLVADLRSPAMRDRHWEQLMTTTKVHFNVNDPAFKLDDLLKLELHKFEEEVRKAAGAREGMDCVPCSLSDQHLPVHVVGCLLAVRTWPAATVSAVACLTMF